MTVEHYAVDYRTHPARNHVPLVEPGSPLNPDLLARTADGFAGRATTHRSCSR